MKKTVTFVWSIFLLVFISIDMNAQSIKSWDYPIKQTKYGQRDIKRGSAEGAA